MGWCAWAGAVVLVWLGWCGWAVMIGLICLGWCGWVVVVGMAWLGWCGWAGVLNVTASQKRHVPLRDVTVERRNAPKHGMFHFT